MDGLFHFKISLRMETATNSNSESGKSDLVRLHDVGVAVRKLDSNVR